MFTLIITIVLQQKEMPMPAPNLSKDLLYKHIYNNQPPWGVCISKNTQRGQCMTGENKARQRQHGVAVVNGQPIIATPERSAAIIDGEEVSVTFEGDDVIVICKEVEVIQTV